MQAGVENREGDSLIANICMEAMHEILESGDLDKVLEDCEKRPSCLYGHNIDDQKPPGFETMQAQYEAEERTFSNQNCWKHEEELKQVSGMNDAELFRKRMFMDKNFVDLLEYMLEDTIFNLMEEATYEEFDLTQAPKIYIRKDDPKI